MKIGLISKHRSAIMGFAILWIMLYHLCGKGECNNFAKSIFAIGHAGVDIFFFLSGLGLTYSYYDRLLTHNERVLYLKKRFLRIIPAYFFVIIITALIFQKPIIDTLWRISCIGFWIGRPYYDWYVPSLLLFYCSFPVFITLSHKYNVYKAVCLFILIGLIGTLGLVLLGKGTVILFVSRIPILFVGCIFGYYMKYVQQTVSKPLARVMICIAIIGILGELIISCNYDAAFLRRSSLHHLPFVFIVPGLCISLSYIFEWISCCVYFKWILLIFSFIGSYSLEIYLSHMSLRYSPWYIFIPIAIFTGFMIKLIIKYIMIYLYGKQQ